MSKGKKFETMVKNTAGELGLFYLRLQDSLKFSRTEDARFAPRSPYDGLLYLNGSLYCLELKNIQGTSLSVGEAKTIKSHQIDELKKANQFSGVRGGLLILFEERQTKKTYREETLIYLPIERFAELWATDADKKSISYEECLSYGYKIEKVKIGVRKMRYDLKSLDSFY